jgi:hypothetical protein
MKTDPRPQSRGAARIPDAALRRSSLTVPSTVDGGAERFIDTAAPVSSHAAPACRDMLTGSRLGSHPERGAGSFGGRGRIINSRGDRLV